MFFDGLRTIYLRGPHSTGIGIWDIKHPGLDYIKHALDVHSFLEHKDVKEKLESVEDPLVLMGHTRYATRGAVTAENAHPFLSGKILLAHNGSLSSIDGMHDFSKFKVDSEAAAYHLDQEGLIPTLKRVNGPYVFTYIDAKEKSFNIIRNWYRDLFYVKHAHRAVWYYSSEKEHLQWILARNNIAVKPSDITSLLPDVLLKYSFGDKSVTTTPQDFRQSYYNGGRGGLPRNAWGWAGEDDDYEDRVPPHKLKQALIDQHNAKFKHTPKIVGGTEAYYARESPYGRPGPMGTFEEYLAQFGLEEHSWIKIKADSFKPYNEQSDCHKGKVEVSFDSIFTPGCWIYAHSFDYKDLGFTEFKPGYYAAKISGGYYSISDGDYVITLGDYARIEDMPEVKEPIMLEKEIAKATGSEDEVVEVVLTGEKIISNEHKGITKKQFKQLTSGGCIICKSNLAWHKRYGTYLVMKTIPVCKNCVVELRDDKKTDEEIVNYALHLKAKEIPDIVDPPETPVEHRVH